MSHKNDSPNLSKKSSGLLKDDYLISVVVSIHGRPQASIAAIFRQSAGYINQFKGKGTRMWNE